jgi:hypothetical protein
VQAEQPLGAGALVQAVDVLSDERDARPVARPPRQDVVRGIGTRVLDHPAAPVVPLPDELGVVRERLGRRQRLGAYLLPESVGTPECGDAGCRGYSGSGENRDTRGRANRRRDALEIGRRGLAHCFLNDATNAIDVVVSVVLKPIGGRLE